MFQLCLFAIVYLVVAEDYVENQLHEDSHLEALLQEEAQNDVNEQFKRDFFKFKPRYRIHVAHKYPLVHHHHHPPRVHVHHAHIKARPFVAHKYKVGGYTTKLIPVQIRPMKLKPMYGPPAPAYGPPAPAYGPPAPVYGPPPPAPTPSYGPPPPPVPASSYGPPMQVSGWKPVSTAPVMWQLPPHHMIMKPFKPAQAPTATKPTIIATMPTQFYPKPTPTGVTTVLKPVAVQPTVVVRPTAHPVQQGAAVHPVAVHPSPPVAVAVHPSPVTVLKPRPVGAVTILQPVPVQQPVHVPVQPVYHVQQPHVISQVPSYIPQNQLVHLSKPHLPVLPLGATYQSPILKPQHYQPLAFGTPVHHLQPHPVHHLEPHPVHPVHQIPIAPAAPAVPVQPAQPAVPVQPAIPEHPFLHLAGTGVGLNPFLHSHFSGLQPIHPQEINPHVPQIPNEHPAQIPTGPHLPGVPGEHHQIPLQPGHPQIPLQPGHPQMPLHPGHPQIPLQIPQQVPHPVGTPVPQHPSQVPQTQLHGQLAHFPSHLLPGQNAHQFSQFQQQLQQYQEQQAQYLPPTAHRLFDNQGFQSQEIYDNSAEDVSNVDPKVLTHSPHVLQQTAEQKPLSVQIPVHLPHHPNYKPDLSKFAPGTTFSLHGNFQQFNGAAESQAPTGSDEKKR